MAAGEEYRRSARSRPTRPAGSRPGSSTGAPTSRSRTRRSTSWGWSGWSRSSPRTTSARPRSSGSASRASTASWSASSSTRRAAARESSASWPANSRRASRSGKVTDAVWSPGLGKNIGYVWVPIELAEPGNAIDGRLRARPDQRAHGRHPVRRPAQGAAGRCAAAHRPGESCETPRFDVLFEPVPDRAGDGAQPVLPGAALQRHGPSAPQRACRDARRQGRGRLGGGLHRGGRVPPLRPSVAPYVEGRIWDDADIPDARAAGRARARARLAGRHRARAQRHDRRRTCTSASRRWARRTCRCTAPTRCRRGG